MLRSTRCCLILQKASLVKQARSKRIYRYVTIVLVVSGWSEQLPQSLQDQVEDEETERVMEQYRQQLNGILSG